MARALMSRRGRCAVSVEKSDPQPSGPALVRAVLDAARSNPKQRVATQKVRRRRGGYSGPGADARDPQAFGTMIARLVDERGWQKPAAEGTLFGAWARIVGPDIAAKCRPVVLRDGELTVEAVSTAWATQLRLFTKMLLAKIARELGDQVVTRIRVHGPAAPSWRKGRLVVQGRGPRDTYG
ncbi:MAG: DUF721 domain-containing protein [Corynebacteriales bacterium]|nr:DUF721 domain-containing protein [Mycobacteriales bacterium]